jgi:hypothetical protein
VREADSSSVGTVVRRTWNNPRSWTCTLGYPPQHRNVLAVLGAYDLLGPGTAREYLSSGTETQLTRWVMQFKGDNVDELPDWPVAPDVID